MRLWSFTFLCNRHVIAQIRQNVRFPFDSDLFILYLVHALFDAFNQECLVSSISYFECTLDYIVAVLVFDEVMQSLGIRYFSNVPGPSLIVSMEKTSFYCIWGELLNAQFVYVNDHLIKYFLTSFHIPVLQNLFNRKVCILILWQFDNRTWDFMEQTWPQILRFRASNNFLYHT